MNQAHIIETEFKKYFSGIHSAKILDVGCGEKRYKKLVNNDCHYVGVDVEESGRKIENKTADIFFDGLNLPFENESFDYIVCNQVLEHAIDDKKLMQEMNRVLKRGGVCL